MSFSFSNFQVLVSESTVGDLRSSEPGDRNSQTVCQTGCAYIFQWAFEMEVAAGV